MFNPIIKDKVRFYQKGKWNNLNVGRYIQGSLLVLSRMKYPRKVQTNQGRYHGYTCERPQNLSALKKEILVLFRILFFG